MLQCVDSSIGESVAPVGTALAQVQEDTTERKTAVQQLVDKYQAPLPDATTAKALRTAVTAAFYSFYGTSDQAFIENDRVYETLGGKSRCLAARFPVDKLDALAPVFLRFVS